MIQCNSLNLKLSKSQLNISKSAIKNETDLFLRLSSNMTDNSDDETNFFINYCSLIDKLQIFVKLYQPILNYQKLNYLR